jgi:hypothetical protein
MIRRINNVYNRGGVREVAAPIWSVVNVYLSVTRDHKYRVIHTEC